LRWSMVMPITVLRYRARTRVRWPGPSARPARPARWGTARGAGRARSRNPRARREPVREHRLQVGEPGRRRVEPGEERLPDQARVTGLVMRRTKTRRPATSATLSYVGPLSMQAAHEDEQP